MSPPPAESSTKENIVVNQNRYVLVHGAWHGGWCWDAVAQQLQAQGHEVICPDLSGLGSRAGEELAAIGLATHVADVTEVLEDAPEPVILVGHSYAGMVATEAAAAVPEKVAKLIVLDGFLPEQGEKAIDLLPPRAAGHYREAAEATGGVSIAPRPMANLGVTDEAVIRETTPRLTPHPAATYFEAAVHGASNVRVPAEFILCAGWSSPFTTSEQRAKDLGWGTYPIDGDHEVMLTDPDLAASALLHSAQRSPELVSN
jgi:pimeloyl-ACP methyl ester carboxylesterase